MLSDRAFRSSSRRTLPLPSESLPGQVLCARIAECRKVISRIDVTEPAENRCLEIDSIVAVGSVGVETTLDRAARDVVETDRSRSAHSHERRRPAAGAIVKIVRGRPLIRVEKIVIDGPFLDDRDVVGLLQRGGGHIRVCRDNVSRGSEIGDVIIEIVELQPPQLQRPGVIVLDGGDRQVNGPSNPQNQPIKEPEGKAAPVNRISPPIPTLPDPERKRRWISQLVRRRPVVRRRRRNTRTLPVIAPDPADDRRPR